MGSNGIDRRMMLRPVSYKRHRFPPEIIAHAVWLYFRFPLSLHLVEEMLLERGIIVSYETDAGRSNSAPITPAA
jgi:transposase-like protein